MVRELWPWGLMGTGFGFIRRGVMDCGDACMV